jgi:hypothetical protein
MLFGGDGLADNGLLDGGIARQDDALGGTVLEQDAQQILGFGADARRQEDGLVRLCSLGRVGVSIAHMRENQLTLLLNRPWIEGPQIVGYCREAHMPQDENQIGAHLSQI